MGYKVISIPYYEWQDIEKSALKYSYIKNKILLEPN
jgi:hypothetical protein